jgi:hypothetical protein
MASTSLNVIDTVPSERMSPNDEDGLGMIISRVSTVSWNLFSSWLYEELEDKKRTNISIKRSQIDCKDGDLRRFIIEEIR